MSEGPVDEPQAAPAEPAEPVEAVTPLEPISVELEPSAEPRPAAGTTPTTQRGRAALEWVAVVVVALLAAFLVRTFVFQTFYIPSGSMEPTLQIGDRIIVSKLSYDFHSVNRGDIIVFHAPPREATVCADPAVQDLVKRVIGLPGDWISSRGNTILIDGTPLAQPWFPAVPLGPAITRTHIGPNSYFVMGDNRSDSCDSRMWGTLPGSNIIGHVILRIWPLSQIGVP
jgi:signal peptidase I